MPKVGLYVIVHLQRRVRATRTLGHRGCATGAKGIAILPLYGFAPYRPRRRAPRVRGANSGPAGAPGPPETARGAARGRQVRLAEAP